MLQFRPNQSNGNILRCRSARGWKLTEPEMKTGEAAHVSARPQKPVGDMLESIYNLLMMFSSPLGPSCETFSTGFCPYASF